MAVAWYRNPVLDESAPIIDRSTVDDLTFGVSETRRHPAYVYSTHRNSCLMHKVLRVTIHWYALIGSGHRMGRLKQPAMIATATCGQSFALTPEKSRTCKVPLPGSVLCGRCHGEGATFPRKGKRRTPLTKEEARVNLGCDVAGYPSALQRDAET